MGTTYGSTAFYSCNRGYRLVGSSTTQCMETGVWVPAVPPSCLTVGNNLYCMITSVSAVLEEVACLAPVFVKVERKFRFMYSVGMTVDI